MNDNKRIAVFVDTINLFHNINTIYTGRKLNYRFYLDKLREEEGNIFRATAYGAAVGDEAKNFITSLRSNGFETKYVSAKRFDNNPIIKYTDRTIDIIIDIIRMMDRLDVVIIGSNNTNISPFLFYLREIGIRVVIFACNIPKELKLVCDEWIEILEDTLKVKEDSLEELEAIKATE
jgi:uncharacterized LabA/DUF88 family protein